MSDAITQQQQTRLRESLQGTRGPDQQRIAEAGLELIDTLLRKNQDYGSSAWKRPLLCPTHVSARDAIMCRLSDKIRRLEQLVRLQRPAEVKESIADTMLDLGGYSLLWSACPEDEPS